jgi:RNA polymerase sigma-70 factor (ECF subfamily)
MTNARSLALIPLPSDRPKTEQAAPEAREETRTDRFPVELAGLRPELKTRALALTHDEAVADDLVQDTLTRALERSDQFRPGTSLKAWATSILRNLLVDRWRRKSPLLGCDLERLAREEPSATLPSHLDLLDIEDVRSAMALLTPRSREIFELAYFLSLPHSAIAARFQVETATVGTSLFRSKAKLRAELERIFAERVGPK